MAEFYDEDVMLEDPEEELLSDVEYDDELGEDVDEDEEDGVSDPTETYWAREEDENTFVAEVADRFEVWQSFTRTSSYFSWCRKAWRLYYGLAFTDDGDEIGTVALGEQGELTGAQLNHLRNLIQHRINMTTRERPALKGRAVNSDLRSQRQAELGTSLIEYYLREGKAERYLHQTVEHAMILADGFLCLTWDPFKGEATDGDEQTLELKYPGDLEFHNPINWNVARDLGVHDRNQWEWVIVRRARNKWRLASMYPEFSEEIISADEWLEVPLEEGSRPMQEQEWIRDTDEVETFEFYHRKSPSMPNGRYALICGGELLQDLPMPYERLPVHHLNASQLMLTPFGYAPAWDLIGIQELINAACSTIATNQDAFGVQNLWSKTGNNLEISELPGGVNLVESEEKPEPLDLCQTPKEVFTFLELLIRQGEYLAGVDSITRGQSQQNITSGAYGALLQSQTAAFATALTNDYNSLLEGVGTAMLEILRAFAKEERVITITGKHNRIYQKNFTGSDLEGVERVIVERANPILSTFAGKLELANMIASTGLVKTPEKLLEVFASGSVAGFDEAEISQLSISREENELALDGKPIPPAMPEDDQLLHLKTHASLYGSTDARNAPALRAAMQPHMMEHIKLFFEDPNTQIMQQLLYAIQIPPGAQPAGSQPPMGGDVPPDMAKQPDAADPGLDGRSEPRVAQPASPPDGAAL